MPPVHYDPDLFPPEQLIDWPSLIPLIGPAAAAVARYDGMLEVVPNPELLLVPLSVREAVLSSRIEGTQASVIDVLEIEAGRKTTSARLLGDAQEIRNYALAMRKAEEMLEKLPLSNRVVRAAHKLLLSGARGHNKAPGTYRRIPNWIGPPGCTVEEATFVPVSAEQLPDALSRWERHIHEDPPDVLVQAATLHAEFEALHPFLDGNGRLGRMLVPLFLWSRGVISRPVFYISAYLEANRDAYYERLLAISRDGDWTGWCRFFLTAIQQQAVDNLAKTRSILNLYEEMKPRVVAATRSQYAIHALDSIFETPILSSAGFAERAGVPKPTAHRLLRKLQQRDILTEIRPSSGSQAAILSFPTLLEVLSD